MITLTDKGLYCEAGDFYIDPLRRVKTALITHAHSDHARRGSEQYLCVNSSMRLLSCRLGHGASIKGVPYRKTFRLGDVTVSFHPAGHILGSAQIRMEQGSKVWVVSGDYKREADPSCEPFEVLRCDTFITEATFGNPKYQWGDTSETVREIFQWWEENRQKDKNSLLYCYALGKSQRVLAALKTFTDRRVLIFGETAELTQCYRQEGIEMVKTESLESLPRHSRLRGELVIAPHSIAKTAWIERLGFPESAFASGWMQTGAFGMGRKYDRGFVMSDHADWPALIQTIKDTGAKQILVQHGGEGALTKFLRKEGLNASALTRPSPQLNLNFA